MVYYTKTDLIALAIALISLIINGVGTFCDQWWEDRTGRRFGLFSKVACVEGICRFSTDMDIWLYVAQVTALVQFFGLIVAILIHLMNICEVYKRVLFRFLTIVVLGLACLFAHVHIFTLSSVYGGLVREFYKQKPLPLNYAYFLTLPLGLNAISGTMTIGPLLALIVVHTKEKKALQGKAKGTQRTPGRNPKKQKAVVV